MVLVPCPLDEAAFLPEAFQRETNGPRLASLDGSEQSYLCHVHPFALLCGDRFLYFLESCGVIVDRLRVASELPRCKVDHALRLVQHIHHLSGGESHRLSHPYPFSLSKYLNYHACLRALVL